MGPWKHLDGGGTTRLGIKALKVPFKVKLTKMSLVDHGLTWSQIWSKSAQNNTFNIFKSNPSYSEIFVNFDQL